MKFQLADSLLRDPSLRDIAYTDPALSYRAKGMLAYLLTLPDSSSFDLKTLASASIEGVSSVKTALWELERAGYCQPAPEANDSADPGSSENGNDTLSLFDHLHVSADPVPELVDAQAQIQKSIVRIMDRLNELRQRAWEWKNFTPLSSRHAKNVENIRGRLDDGYSEDDLLLVLEYLAAVDGGREETRRYFDSVTPFRPKNFERNLTIARDWAARGRPVSESQAQQRLEQSHDPSVYDRGRRGGSA